MSDKSINDQNNKLKNLDQKQLEFQQDFSVVESTVFKNYLPFLSKCKIASFEDGFDNPEDIANDYENIMLFKITEMVYEKDEYSLYKLATVFNSVSHTKCTVFVIMDSDGTKTDFYMGIRNNDKQRTTAGIRTTLKNAFVGQFPGAKVEPLKQNSEIIEKLKNDQSNNVISAVSCVANAKDREMKDNDSFLQGLEKFVLSAQGKEYTAIILANSVSHKDILHVKKTYEDIYTILSPFSKSQIGWNYSESYTKSKVDKDNFKPTEIKKRSSSNPVAALGVSKRKGSNFKILDNVAGFLAGKLMGATESQNKTKGESANYTIENKQITNILEKIDIEFKRLNEFESLGAWNCAAYFMSPMPSVAEQIASMYQALMSGENTGVETTAINTWRKKKTDVQELENYQKIREYITHFKHPKFVLMDSDDLMVDATNAVSSNELAIHMGLPRHSVCGLPVIEHADFAKEIVKYSGSDKIGDTKIGRVFNMGSITDTEVRLDKESFSMHTFITGSTGSGKSNTVYKLIEQIGCKFMVVEPAKGEYKNVFGNRSDVKVYGTNPALSLLLRINPFAFPSEIHIYEHIDRLVEIFNACWPMYAAMPAVLKSAIITAYEKCGWDLVRSVSRTAEVKFPTFNDVAVSVNELITNSSYSADTKGDYIGSLLTRLESLTTGINSLVFVEKELDSAQLFDENIIVDLSRVGSLETKSLIMGILIMKLNEYRMSSATEMNAQLKHVTILEEAHNLLKATSTEQGQESANLAGKSVEMISNAIAEMRTYGEGFIIVDQSPSAVDISAIKNTNTKIIMRLPEENDRRIAGKAAALKDEQIDEISKLPKGVAVVYQNDWVEPILCKVDKFNGEEVQYTFNYTESEEVTREKKYNLNLFGLLLGRGKRYSFDIEFLAENTERVQLDEKLKSQIKKLIHEYRKTGQLDIWRQENFLELAKIVATVVFPRTKLSIVIGSCKNVHQINQLFEKALSYCVDVSEMSDIFKLDIYQCFLKKFSSDTKDVRLYKLWLDTIKKERETYAD